MKDERLTQLVKEGFLSPAAGVKALGFKSTHIKDIDFLHNLR